VIDLSRVEKRYKLPHAGRYAVLIYRCGSGFRKDELVWRIDHYEPDGPFDAKEMVERGFSRLPTLLTPLTSIPLTKGEVAKLWRQMTPEELTPEEPDERPSSGLPEDFYWG
jgi:hypothetical protein